MARSNVALLEDEPIHDSSAQGPKEITTMMTRLEPSEQMHTVSLYVRNVPGALVRIALVFSRRAYNIESLVVSPGAQDGFSRMTITCSGNAAEFGQIIKQLQKLVDVVRAVDHTSDNHYETEIALIKVAAPLTERTEILQVAEHYNAKVVDYGTDSIILRVYGSSDKLDSFVNILRNYEILELVRSGKVLMARGSAIT